jgi:phosphonoacetaldehyde hydrolase
MTSSIKAVIFDWAGTLVDFGSSAPMGAFVDLFAQEGVSITVAQARGPMGLPKRDHIIALGQTPDIARAWRDARGENFSEADADRLLARFEPMSAKAALARAEMIPGAHAAIQQLRREGILIGTTTGYTRFIMNGVLSEASRQGFEPDCVVCTDDVKSGRPSPLGIYKCLLELNVWPARAVVKVDDTVPGLAEGLAAGCWTVGVSVSGNALGLDQSEFEALTEDERLRRVTAAEVLLRQGGAHEVIPSVANLDSALERIRVRMTAGEHPWDRTL